MQFKKARLIWEEYIEANLDNTCIDPQVSFDYGNSWMSLLNKAVNLRLTGSAVGSNIKSTKNGFKQLDVMFGFTPYFVPKIMDCEIIPDAVKGKPAGTYYFAVTAMLFDTPGADVKVGGGFYASGPSSTPFSKLYKVVLTEPSTINLYINYPHFAKGVCVYYGNSVGSTVNLELHTVTNLTQKLRINMDTSTNPIQLFNDFPFPKTGTVKIENEYIDYTNCTWNSTYWQLIGLTRGARGTAVVAHNNPDTSNRLPIYLASYDGGDYGEIPAKIYPRPNININLLQYLNFNGNNIVDLTKSTIPSIIGDVDYSVINRNYGTSLRFTGYGIVNLGLSLGTTGSIYFNIYITDTHITEVVDPVIFGDINGLWMKLSKFNNKPYIGYKEKTLINFEDYRIMSISKNEFHRLGLSWRKNITTENVELELYYDGFQILKEDIQIKFSEFIPGSPYLGGFYNSETLSISNTFYGYINNWKIFNIYNSSSEFETMYNLELTLPDINCGKISFNSDFYNYNTITNTTLSNYSPLIYTKFDGVSTVAGQAGLDYGTFYDDWAIESFLTDSNITSGARISYPLDSESIQVKFNMTGSVDGYISPLIKNIALIVSEASVTEAGSYCTSFFN